MAKSNSRNGSRHMMICKNDHGKKFFLPRGKYFSPTREENFSHGENSPVFRLPPYPKAMGHKKSPHLRCRAIYRCSHGVDYHRSLSAAKIRQKNWPCKKIGKNLRKSYVKNKIRCIIRKKALSLQWEKWTICYQNSIPYYYIYPLSCWQRQYWVLCCAT